jgi:hypothetical protein
VFVGVDIGLLRVSGAEAPGMTNLAGVCTGQRGVEVLPCATLVCVYDIWDSVRGVNSHESQKATLRHAQDHLPDGGLRYQCNDIGFDLRFDDLEFTLRLP